MNNKPKTANQPILIVRNVKITAPNGTLLIDGADFFLNGDAKVALVGGNGTGKSTLMKAIASKLDLEDGEIRTAKKGQLIEYVPQFPPEELGEKTLLEAVKDYLIAQRGNSGEEWKAYTALTELGFDEHQFDTKFKDLSGGEINQALLARSLITEPDIILLDEPTNHLDTEGVLKFEQVLEEIKMPFLIISHDRELLDRFTTRTLFLENGKIKSFNLPYSLAKNELLQQKEALQELRREQEKRRDRIAANVKWLKDKAKISDEMAPVYRAAQTKLKRFEGEMIEIPKQKKRNISLKSTDFQGQFAMQVCDWLVKVPGTEQVLYAVKNLALQSGDRAVIMGVNGAGKTTLLESLVETERIKDYPTKDESGIRFNPQVQIGYYDQKQREMDFQQSLHRYLIQKTSLTPQQAHATLVNAGFPYERHQDIIGLLSGGERARLQLLAINKAGTNFLVLDEPTNHLDLEGIERLEQELAAFEGTVVLVSHDRRFIENVGNRFFLIKNSQLQEVSSIDIYYSYLQDYLLRTSLSQVAPQNDARPVVKEPIVQANLTLLSDDELYQHYFEIEEELRQKTPGTKVYRQLIKKLGVLEQQIDRRL